MALRNARNRILQPQLLLVGLVAHLTACADIFDAVGTAQSDVRWQDVADALRAAAHTVRRTQLVVSRP